MGDGVGAANSDEEFERRVVETFKLCERRNEPPVVWAIEVAKCAVSAGVGLPSVELGELLLSQLCFSHKPSLWKFLDTALSSGLLSPLHILALLASRIIPHRWSQPEAYRLYLELLSKYAFSFYGIGGNECQKKIIRSIDVALQLSQTYEVQALELGHVLVLSFFTICLGLIDSTLSDWGLQMTSADKGRGTIAREDRQKMEVDSKGGRICKRNQHPESLRRSNSFMAFEMLAKLTENRKAMVLLRLVYLNMPETFNGLLQRMQFLEVQKLASPDLTSADHTLAKLSLNIQRAMDFEYQFNSHHLTGLLIDIKSHKRSPCYNTKSGRFACWVPFDIYMENAMDGKQFPATSAIDVLTELINTLKVFNRASWQETFLALWLSALRLVQREREPIEGPVPQLEARLCALLSITPLAIARVLEDDSVPSSSGGVASMYVEIGHGCGRNGNDHASRRQGLISSLQVLGHFTALLCPPASVVDAANNAAAKAATFISNSENVKNGTSTGGYSDAFGKTGGDMRHLIVEACLARKLIDTSTYVWPGYVCATMTSLSDSLHLQKSPWAIFMEGAPLTGPLVNTLMTNPASSIAEVEKLYYIALNGSEDEKSAAAKILCGASLTCGWTIQEYVVQFVVKLLSPPIPQNFIGSRSHLVDYMPMLNSILLGAASIDTVHILSLHGVVPQIAASLMPLCETFGSLPPASNQKSSKGDESSVYMVFSSAFLFLLRLWKFYRPPLEHCIEGRGGANGSELTLEYLLILRNSRIQSYNSASRDHTVSSSNLHESARIKPMYIDSYPKLRAWYCQNKSCIASTLSGLCNGNPVHQVANKILNMIYWKITKSGTTSTDSSMSSSNDFGGPSTSTGEDVYQISMLPAWEVLEAIPFVLEAILTACAHGKLSSRDLTTGLRDLVNFLPASLAAIISYFSAEVTRGVWKPVLMNGKDWPSPAVNLLSVESEIKDILAAAGVSIPGSSSGVSPAILPLPMAILVSLTITFKLDKSLECIQAVVGPALEHCASGCPWLSMPIIGSLWAQKIRRWHDFIVVSCSRSVFRQDQGAVAQLLRSCFTSFLGSLHPSSSPLISQNGVNGLLGSVISAPGHTPRVAPGFLYLRTCRTMLHVYHRLNHVIVELVAGSSRELATRWASTDSPRLMSARSSLNVTIAKAKEVATLGASLLCAAGGLQLVQELYQETVPTWFLSARDQNCGKANSVSRILEGYTMAYMVVLSGSFIWGVGDKPTSWAFSRRLSGFGVHMDFVVGVLEGNISLGCDPATWKAYVSCLVSLLVSFAPMWIGEVKAETLRKLASGLRGWHECELALSLLERGGLAAMGSVAQFVNEI